MRSPLARLIQTIEAAGLDCDGRDLADAVWLAAWLPASDGADKEQPAAPAGAEAPPASPMAEPTSAAKEGDQSAGAPAGATADLHLPGGVAGAGPVAGRAVRTPAADALPGRLALARALRPLMRRVPSRTVHVLDEEATVERIAGGDVWTPQFRPVPERRFRVTLVVDDSRSMAIWRRTAHELHVLFRWTGAFRDLRMLRMNGDAGTAPESVGPGGDHLVLVLSDCVSMAWWDGRAFGQLEQWGQSAAVCLLQALPEPMWARTALRRAQGVELRRRGPALANVRLEATPIDSWLSAAAPEGLRLPVATLQPGAIGPLARLLADPSGGGSRGLVVGRGIAQPAAGGTPEVSAEDRVRTFKRLASPTALRLARLVAVSPVVSLQVVRLIRGAMLREASQVHEAEVLLGGILYALRDPGEDLALTNDVYFRFHDGVADLLLDGLPVPDWVEVLAKVSEHAERHWGAPQGFRAILADPTAAAPTAEVSSHPFLRLVAARLERLGGEYAELARRLGSSVSPFPVPATAGPEPQATASQTTSVQPPSPPPVRSVQFIVYQPKAVRSGKRYLMLVVPHQREPGAPVDEVLPDESARLWVEQRLGPRASQYLKSTNDRPLLLPPQSEITLAPDIEGVKIEPGRHTFRLVGGEAGLEFTIRARRVQEGKTLRGTLPVLLSDQVLAEVPLRVRVRRTKPPAIGSEQDREKSDLPRRKVFACYSSRDRVIVLQFLRQAEAMGDEYFEPLYKLSLADIWDERTLQLIEGADVFQLFWSSNAAASEWTRREWQYALSLGRKDFIRPVYWEDPLPGPPEELRHLDFQRLELSPGTVAEPTGEVQLAAKLAQDLLNRGENDAAFRMLTEALTRFPDDQRLRRLMGLYHARAGELEKAVEWLEPFEGYVPDNESTAILAGVYKRFWQRDRARQDYLEKAHLCYRTAWEASKPGAVYLGINAAATALWLGLRDDAQEMAAEVRKELLHRVAPTEELSYWDQVTLADAELLLGNLSAARQHYRSAFAHSTAQLAAVEAARKQLGEILPFLGGGSVDEFLDDPRPDPWVEVQIYISYRRDDTAEAARAIRSHLIARYGAASVVMDVNFLLRGADFRETLLEAVGHCHVVLVLISPKWLDNPPDWVRVEIAVALERAIPIIPVLVGDAAFPAVHELPPPLHLLASYRSTLFREGPERNRDLDRLCRSLDRILGRETPPPAPPAMPREIVNSLGMKLVLVPAGTFWMGGGGGQPGERQVTIDKPFYIGVYPVTQAQWQEVMGYNPSYFVISNGGGPDHPVERVSWNDVQQFIEKLNAREQGRGLLYRLPTEAEWEYSCRGGATSQEECSYHFYLDRSSNSLGSNQANFDGNYPDGDAAKGPYLERTTKVGSYQPNRLGIYDMHGNVWEWCADLWEEGGLARVFRGGCWGYSGSRCQAAYRRRNEPSYRVNGLGVRLAAVPSSR
jgi:formylglycine-generating enzyme required for sulfatase activity/tetratricopeptide (TPR) repeat protein